MEDKRIKLITKEMFIAWGMICIGFIIVDTALDIFGITPLLSCRPRLQGVGAIAKAIIFYSSFLAILISTFSIGLIKFIAIKSDPAFFMTVLSVIIVMIQFFIYWYLGNICGRFIVWIKHVRNKAKPEPPETKEG